MPCRQGTPSRRPRRSCHAGRTGFPWRPARRSASTGRRSRSWSGCRPVHRPGSRRRLSTLNGAPDRRRYARSPSNCHTLSRSSAARTRPAAVRPAQRRAVAPGRAPLRRVDDQAGHGAGCLAAGDRASARSHDDLLARALDSEVDAEILDEGEGHRGEADPAADDRSVVSRSDLGDDLLVLADERALLERVDAVGVTDGDADQQRVARRRSTRRAQDFQSSRRNVRSTTSTSNPACSSEVVSTSSAYGATGGWTLLGFTSATRRSLIEISSSSALTRTFTGPGHPQVAACRPRCRPPAAGRPRAVPGRAACLRPCGVTRVATTPALTRCCGQQDMLA